MTTAQYYLDNGAKDSGAANLVSPIVLDYRAYDTLGEVTVLFAAILGTITIIRIKSKTKKLNTEINHAAK
jgi:multisubunit Na+/H+ antiporter MnhB subunit